MENYEKIWVIDVPVQGDVKIRECESSEDTTRPDLQMQFIIRNKNDIARIIGDYEGPRWRDVHAAARGILKIQGDRQL